MRKFRAFTLIELLIVVVIIGILATFVVISLNGAQKRARNTNAINSVSEVKDSLSTYYGLTNDLSGLNTGTCDAAVGTWVNAYSCGSILEAAGAKGFSTQPKDARGNQIRFKVTDATNGYFSAAGKAADNTHCWYYNKAASVSQNLDSGSSVGGSCPVGF